MKWLRHLLAILALPFLAAVVLPYWLLTRFDALAGAHDDRWLLLVRLVAALFLAVGMVLFFWCVGLFASVGRGTLAP